MASKTKKIVVGCAIGCGSLILLGVILLMSFFSWVGRPGELLEPVRLLGEDTTGYAEWTLRLEDSGTEQFVEGLLQRNTVAERRKRGQEIKTPLPPEFETFLFSWQEKRDRDKLKGAFPLVGAWTMSDGGEGGKDRHLFSVSLKAAGNRMVFADWILGWMPFSSDGDEELQRIPYRDELLFRLLLPDNDLELVFFIRGNDLFFCYDLVTARRAVDRLSAEPGSRQPSRLDTLFAGVPEDSALRGALSNDRGEVFEMWSRLASEIEDRAGLQQVAADLRGATVDGGLVDEDTLAGRVGLWAPDAAWAAEQVDTALDAFREGFALEGVEFAADAAVEGEWIRIDFRITGLAELLDSFGQLGPGPFIVIEPGGHEAPEADDAPDPPSPG